MVLLKLGGRANYKPFGASRVDGVPGMVTIQFTCTDRL